MGTQTAEATLQEYLLQGIAKEIFFADEAKALCVEVGNHAEKVNAQGYGQLFGSLQVSYSGRQTLCVTKMFDPEDRRFPTRSIPATLNLIERHASLWSLPQKQKLQETLVIAGHDKQSVFALDNTQLSLAIAAHFKGTLPQGDNASADQLSLALRNLREARNKVIAHNEAIAKSARTLATWGEAELLVTYAKNFVTTISSGFLSLYMGNDSNTYHATADAHRTAAALNRLLKAANLVK
jgi:hypothetical protein